MGFISPKQIYANVIICFMVFVLSGCSSGVKFITNKPTIGYFKETVKSLNNEMLNREIYGTYESIADSCDSRVCIKRYPDSISVIFKEIYIKNGDEWDLVNPSFINQPICVVIDKLGALQNSERLEICKQAIAQVSENCEEIDYYSEIVKGIVFPCGWSWLPTTVGIESQVYATDLNNFIFLDNPRSQWLTASCELNRIRKSKYYYLKINSKNALEVNCIYRATERDTCSNNFFSFYERVISSIASEDGNCLISN